MRAFGGIGVGEDQLRSRLLRAADRLHKRIGEFHRNIHGLLGIVVAAVYI